MGSQKTHLIPLLALVETTTGARMFVVSHELDCDGTPLYCLCADPEDTVREREGFGNRKWHCGHPGYCLKVIQVP